MLPIDPKAGQSNAGTGRVIARIAFVMITLVAASIAGYLTGMKLTGQISELAGCGGNSGCGSILRGRWANWMLVPVSLWAMLFYVGLLAIGLRGFQLAINRKLAFAATSVLAAAAVWFLGIQLFVEQQFCVYCMAMHACGIVLFAIAAMQLIGNVAEVGSALRTSLLVTGLTMSVLVAGQLLGPQPKTHEITGEMLTSFEPIEQTPQSPHNRLGDSISSGSTPEVDDDANAGDSPLSSAAAQPVATQPFATQPLGSAPSASEPEPIENRSAELTESSPSHATVQQPATQSTSLAAVTSKQQPLGRVVSYFDGKIKFPIEQVPCLGPPDAPHVLVKYFDYTCPSCRRLNDDLEQLEEKWPGKIAVISLPCPLNRACNPHAEARDTETEQLHQHACELARLALAVWHASPKEFPGFHRELFRMQGSMTPAAARIVAEGLVGKQALADSLQSPIVEQLIRHAVSVYGKLKKQNPRMPKMLLGGDQVLHGVYVDSAAFFRAMEKQLSLSGQ